MLVYVRQKKVNLLVLEHRRIREKWPRQWFLFRLREIYYVRRSGCAVVGRHFVFSVDTFVKFVVIFTVIATMVLVSVQMCEGVQFLRPFGIVSC